MPNMTLAVPEDLHREMKRHPEVRWAEVVRRALIRELDRLKVYDRLLAGSHMTEKSALELARSVNKAAARRVR